MKEHCLLSVKVSQTQVVFFSFFSQIYLSFLGTFPHPFLLISFYLRILNLMLNKIINLLISVLAEDEISNSP